MNDSSWMAQLAGKYKTITTVVHPGSVGVRLLLGANVRRFWVRFVNGVGPGIGSFIMPGPVPSDFVVMTDISSFRDYKFSDSPSVVQGEWYIYDDGTFLGTVHECVYTGE